ncbi:redoxin domain protein [Ichthyophthirius multifiliis]|uniref:Redoxin domain protein n=1 Tax=Ichthyophthirius multifiliis TaxID=5932 RepID=G0QYB0_ICHMU|nr:redoxin domain protein [Ichthyophthirius multifiliis]EGR29773.1 redoxin domain protein [Ichthyophthirius multifiliis]|eukprot:XP_004031009.1 redoxin domain protein [Ichthyophthirius multifiliis]
MNNLIKLQSKFPSVVLTSIQAIEGTCGGTIQKYNTEELFKNKRVVLFSVPGAFTPTCSAQHVPGFLKLANDFKTQKNVQLIVCVSVNDVYVMDAWRQNQGIKNNEILMLSDPNGQLAQQTGLTLDLIDKGLGLRMKRAAFLIDDGIVKHFAVDEGKFHDTSAEEVFKAI